MQTTGLQNYWTFCSNLVDLITNLTLYNGVNVSFSSNRYNTPSSALSLSSGYIQVPNRVYFNGEDYSIMAWVYLRAFNSYTRLLDFGNGNRMDNVVCVLSHGTTGRVYQVINQEPLMCLLCSQVKHLV